MEAYLLALEQELSWLENTFQVDTLYLGGGTPSHLPPVLLEQLFQIVLQRFTLADRFEFTMEANPADITPDLVEVMKTYQVNRVRIFQGDRVFIAKLETS